MSVMRGASDSDAYLGASQSSQPFATLYIRSTATTATRDTMSKVDKEIMMLESILESRRAEQKEAARVAAAKRDV